MTNENEMLLKKALLESTSQEVDKIDAIQAPDCLPSPEFKSKIYNSHIKKRIFTPKRLIFSITALIIAAIIVIMISTSANEPPVFDYTIQISENSVSLSVSGELEKITPREIELVYSPLYSMHNRGYKLRLREISAHEISYRFADESKNTDIDLRQSVISGFTITSDESLEELYREIYVDDVKLYLFERDTRSVIVWMYEEYEFILDYNTYLTDWEEVERIIKETIYSTPVPISELE